MSPQIVNQSVIQFVERIQIQSTHQRKIPVPKKFWKEFPLNALVKIELMDTPALFFVDMVQAQGKVQRKIPVPQKFWDFFAADTIVTIELMRKTA